MPEKEQLYILDTNVLVEDPEAIFKFDKARIGIPVIVLEELDRIKVETSSRGANARMIARHLDKIRSKGSLRDGVHLENGAVVQVLFEAEVKQAPKIRIDVADNKILMLAIAMQEQGHDVVFVTKDINARIKADALGIASQDYLRGIVLADKYYKGWQEYDISGSDLRKGEPDLLKQLANDDMIRVNEFAVLYSKGNQYNNRIFRYRGGSIFHEVALPETQWPLTAKNIHQLMALDLLFDDDISVLTMTGPAGTGKTFLALFAGLYNVLVSEKFYRMTIARSVVPLGHDIGFLPGDVQEKLHGWMQPIYDNVDMIAHLIAEAQTMSFFGGGEHATYDDARKKRKRRKRSSFKERERRMFSSLDDLLEQNKVALEAITYMRGRSIAQQFIFIDEVQNLTPHEVKTLLSRVSADSKIILSGDPYQIDVPYLDFSTNGLMVATDRLKGQSIFGTVFMPISERSELSRLVQELL